jgi:predicted ArsR family transcriptional regulator
VAILRLVRAATAGPDAGAGLTGFEIAEATGLHPSTVRAHVEHLVRAGLLVRARASGGAPGRPAWRYRAAAAEPAPAPYRALAAALLARLAPGAATKAGEAWGGGLAAAAPALRPPVETVVDVLGQLGFDPRVRDVSDGDGAGAAVEVHLHTCPFLDLVGPQPDAMCALHAGMIRGVLHAAGAPAGQASLEPFAAPTACVARLRVPPPRRAPGPRR